MPCISENWRKRGYGANSLSAVEQRQNHVCQHLGIRNNHLKYSRNFYGGRRVKYRWQLFEERKCDKNTLRLLSEKWLGEGGVKAQGSVSLQQRKSYHIYAGREPREYGSVEMWEWGWVRLQRKLWWMASEGTHGLGERRREGQTMADRTKLECLYPERSMFQEVSCHWGACFWKGVCFRKCPVTPIFSLS